MVNESVKLAIASLTKITQNEVRPDGNCVVSADKLNLVLEAAAKGIELKKETKNLEGAYDWSFMFWGRSF